MSTPSWCDLPVGDFERRTSFHQPGVPSGTVGGRRPAMSMTRNLRHLVRPSRDPHRRASGRLPIRSSPRPPCTNPHLRTPPTPLCRTAQGPSVVSTDPQSRHRPHWSAPWSPRTHPIGAMPSHLERSKLLPAAWYHDTRYNSASPTVSRSARKRLRFRGHLWVLQPHCLQQLIHRCLKNCPHNGRSRSDLPLQPHPLNSPPCRLLDDGPWAGLEMAARIIPLGRPGPDPGLI